MLLEIAIGDAYGAGFEFCARQKIIEHNTLAAYVAHELGIDAGCYTDDTQMSLALAELLLATPSINGYQAADAFVRCYRRDPRPGYAKGLQCLLDECGDGAALLRRITPHSRRNGAAMRSVPLGLISDRHQLMAAAREQAAVTHDTPEGIQSSQVVALMAHALLYEQLALADLPKFIRRETGFELSTNWKGEVACDAIETVRAVHTALARNRSMADLLRDCVDFGGDVDSVAAIALGIASLSPEYDAKIPAALYEGLESGPYGRIYLAQLDAKLSERFPALGKRA
jgi:ADP-ribosyl-[dinitrogen reductase] hydrolase